MASKQLQEFLVNKKLKKLDASKVSWTNEYDIPSTFSKLNRLQSRKFTGSFRKPHSTRRN